MIGQRIRQRKLSKWFQTDAQLYFLTFLRRINLFIVYTYLTEDKNVYSTVLKFVLNFKVDFTS
jgi:hypothetical protein